MKLKKPISKNQVAALATLARIATHQEALCTEYRELWPIITPFLEIAPRGGISMGVDFLIGKGIINPTDRGNALKAFQRVKKGVQS